MSKKNSNFIAENRTGNRIQVYPSSSEKLFVAMLMKDTDFTKETQLIRLMINFFMEYEDKKVELVNYSKKYIRLNNEVINTHNRTNSEISTRDELISSDIYNKIERILNIVNDLKNTSED